MPPIASRPLFFYSSWPPDYHNREATRKALAFADSGYDVVYVTGVGYRNPGPSHARKLADRTVRKLRGERRSSVGPRLRTAGLAVLPPRQLGPVRRLNVAWLERQLEAAVSPWSRTVAWIRQETPEVIDALSRLNPAVTVYECVDAHHESPGLTGPWVRIFEEAQRSLVQLADVVVVTSETLAERFDGWGTEVRHIPHGVDLFPWQEAVSRDERPLTLGFLGVLDGRLDVPVIRHVAAQRPGWRIRLVGPVEEGFHPRDLADLANVTIEPPVPHTEIGKTLAEFDVGLMAYAATAVYRHMSPLKNLELMAAGRPAVARPTPALMAFGDLLYFAETPDEFVGQAERAAREDDSRLARRRRCVAEQHGWDRTLGQLEDLLDELIAGVAT